MPTSDELALARNIINQIGDLWHERIPSDKWVAVRQQTNDELDRWVSGLLATLARDAAKQALNDAAEVFATSEGVEATMFANDNVEAVRATEAWLRAYAEQIGEVK